MNQSTTIHDEDHRRAGLRQLLATEYGDTPQAALATELNDLASYMLARAGRARPTRHMAIREDGVAALRLRIDERIEALTSPAVELDDPILGLIGDLVEYRIALWNEPVPYVPTYARAKTEREWEREQSLTGDGQAIQEEGVLAELEELQYTSLGEVGELIGATGPLVVIHVHNAVGVEN